MKKINETSNSKRLLIIAIFTVLICFVSVFGATFALFTNDSKDGTIGVNVTTGKVKVDIVDTSDKSLEGDVLDFMVTQNQKEIYFEPGATIFTQGFQIKNKGNIPINFKLYISDDVNFDMGVFKEAFNIFITDDPFNLDGAEKLEFFTGTLAKDQKSAVYYLVIQMKTTANNDFQNQKYQGIGVTVNAVQANIEIE